MLHNKIVDTADLDAEAWISRFWVSGDEGDRIKLAEILPELPSPHIPGEGEQPDVFAIAETLRQLDVDQPTIFAALLSSPALEKKLSVSDIAQRYGETISVICDNTRRLQYFHEYTVAGGDEELIRLQAEQVRRMVLAIIDDVRAVLIKLAWHLQYLRLLASQAHDQNHKNLGHQTLEVFAPLANRLGISQLKWEMEDLAFRFLQPEQYKSIAKSLDDKRLEREAYITCFLGELEKILGQKRIAAEIYGRPKHIYSIWKKMHRKGLAIEQLFDLRAVRIIVDDVRGCYETLDIIHKTWLHVPEEWDDYIANKKPNGYQSIHTVVIGPEGKYVEIQIRTKEMHELAELGVASHWRYKEGGKEDEALEAAVSSIRRLLDHDDSDGELIDDFKTELFSDRVFVISPKGKVVDLVKGATPIDFAYSIHSDIGHRTIGAKVNGSIVPLNHMLRNGEQVEVLTGKIPQPRLNWISEGLGFVKSPRTKQKINHWFRQQNHEQNLLDGRALLEQEKHKLNLPQVKAEQVADHFHRSHRDFLIALGRGDISIKALNNALIGNHQQDIQFKRVAKSASQKNSDIEVEGVAGLVTHLAHCCQPIYGDVIQGFITQSRGISIHNEGCSNFEHLKTKQPERVCRVRWGGSGEVFVVDIIVFGFNEPGMLRDVADVLAKERINVVKIDMSSNADRDAAEIKLAIQLDDTTKLSTILDKLLQLPSVTDAQRYKL